MLCVFNVVSLLLLISKYLSRKLIGIIKRQLQQLQLSIDQNEKNTKEEHN